MQSELKLGYKEYLVSLKYSALKFIEQYGPEQEIEVFYDSISKKDSINYWNALQISNKEL